MKGIVKSLKTKWKETPTGIITGKVIFCLLNNLFIDFVFKLSSLVLPGLGVSTFFPPGGKGC